jgi:hypothetical protein
MKHLKKFNEENEYHDIQECMIGETHTITDTNISYVIDGEEYSFTLREHSNITGSNYKFEFLKSLFYIFIGLFVYLQFYMTYLILN